MNLTFNITSDGSTTFKFIPILDTLTSTPTSNQSTDNNSNKNSTTNKNSVGYQVGKLEIEKGILAYYLFSENIYYGTTTNDIKNFKLRAGQPNGKDLYMDYYLQ